MIVILKLWVSQLNGNETQTSTTLPTGTLQYHRYHKEKVSLYIYHIESIKWPQKIYISYVPSYTVLSEDYVNVIILQTFHQVSCKNMYRHVVICHLGLEFNMLLRTPNCQIWWEQKLACFTPAYTKKAPNPSVSGNKA